MFIVTRYITQRRDSYLGGEAGRAVEKVIIAYLRNVIISFRHVARRHCRVYYNSFFFFRDSFWVGLSLAFSSRAAILPDFRGHR